MIPRGMPGDTRLPCDGTWSTKTSGFHEFRLVICHWPRRYSRGYSYQTARISSGGTGDNTEGSGARTIIIQTAHPGTFVCLKGNF